MKNYVKGLIDKKDCKIALDLSNCSFEDCNPYFRGCTGLTSINIPNSVTKIGGHAFRNCTGLTSINIPDSVTEIGAYAFRGCKNILITVSPANKHYCSLNGIVYNKSKNTIITCSGSLKGTFAIPESVTTIGDGAFSGCTGLTGITIPDSVTEIESVTFISCTSLINVSLPDSITNIYGEAFVDCPNLKTITIPKNCEVSDIAFGEGINIIKR